MKRILKISLIFFFIFGLTGCQGQWKRYTNKEYSFSVLFPSRWQAQEKLYNTVILVKEPLIKAGSDKFQANISVLVTDLPQHLSLNTFFELNKDELIRNLAAITNILEGDVFAGLLPGKWLAFDGQMKDLTLRLVVAVWIKDKRVYTITCSALSREYPKYEKIFFKVMRSLRVK